MQAGCLEFPQLFFAVSSESYSYIFNLPWLSQDRIYCFKNNKDLNIIFIRIIIIWGRGMLNFVAWSRDDMSNIHWVDRFGSSSFRKWEGAKFIWLIFSKYIGQELGDRRQWHMLTWGYKNKCCFILASIMMNKHSTSSLLNWICTYLTCLSLGNFDAPFVMFGAQAMALWLDLGFDWPSGKCEGGKLNREFFFLNLYRVKMSSQSSWIIFTSFVVSCLLLLCLAKLSSILHEVIPMGFIFWHQLFA